MLGLRMEKCGKSWREWIKNYMVRPCQNHLKRRYVVRKEVKGYFYPTVNFSRFIIDTAMVSCSRFWWFTNSNDRWRVWTAKLLHVIQLGSSITCKRFEVQTWLEVEVSQLYYWCGYGLIQETPFIECNFLKMTLTWLWHEVIQ